jgi:hypothetical protein
MSHHPLASCTRFRISVALITDPGMRPVRVLSGECVNNRMLRADRAVSLLLARERGARRHTVQPAPLAPVAVAHAARGGCGGRAFAAAGAAATFERQHADAAGAGAPAPAKHPRGLSPGAARRPHRARRARCPSAGARLVARCQRHALLHRL